MILFQKRHDLLEGAAARTGHILRIDNRTSETTEGINRFLLLFQIARIAVIGNDIRLGQLDGIQGA